MVRRRNVELRPHQVQSVETLLDIFRRHNSAVDWSDTGTGKTFVACAVAKRLALPTLAITPKIAVSAWHRTAELLGDSVSVMNYETLRTGNTPFGTWEKKIPARQYFVCQCCQQKIDTAIMSPCYTNFLGVHCLETKKRPAQRGKFSFHPSVKFVIFDEAHRCGALDSLNSEMLIAAKRQGIKTLLLSATPADSVLKMRALGYALDLHALHNFYGWAIGYGCRRHPAFRGLHWMLGEEKQKQVMAEIRGRIIPSRGVRVTVNQIPGFPECDISAELYDISKPDEINRLYQTMQEALLALESSTINDAAPDHPLTKILRARQKIELLKVPIVVELVADAVEKGQSVGVFANFRQTLEQLQRLIPEARIIDGGVTGSEREEVINEFQAHKIRVLLLNSEVGGITISLQDLDGEHPRIGFVMPGFSATTFKQLCGRFPRFGGRSKSHYRVVLAAGTVETKVYAALRRKGGNLDALTDADFVPAGIAY